MSFFKPEDFDQGAYRGRFDNLITHEEAAKSAEKILQERGVRSTLQVTYEYGIPGNGITTEKTKPREVLIVYLDEPIKRACSHERISWANKIPGWHHSTDSIAMCDECGIKLKAKWLAEGD